MESLIYKSGISIVIPTFNEGKNILFLINNLISQFKENNVEIIVVDDNSNDGTAEIVKEASISDPRIRLIPRVGRSGLSSAIKEGLLAAKYNIGGVIDGDGQVQAEDLKKAVLRLFKEKLDIVIGSRFLNDSKRSGLSNKRSLASSAANYLCRLSLPKNYSHITDYQSISMAINLKKCLPIIYRINVNGFKFSYELLSLSKGKLRIDDVPLNFKPRMHGDSKLDLAIVWDFLTQLLHIFSGRIIPKRAVSFGLVGMIGSLIQLTSTEILMRLLSFDFYSSIYVSVYIAATSNYIINNLLTFKNNRLTGIRLFKGLLKYMLVITLPLLANVGLATAFYKQIYNNTIIAQLGGIIVVFVWNYAASSRFLWNNPK